MLFPVFLFISVYMTILINSGVFVTYVYNNNFSNPRHAATPPLRLVGLETNGTVIERIHGGNSGDSVGAFSGNANWMLMVDGDL